MWSKSGDQRRAAVRWRFFGRHPFFSGSAVRVNHALQRRATRLFASSTSSWRPPSNARFLWPS